MTPLALLLALAAPAGALSPSAESRVRALLPAGLELPPAPAAVPGRALPSPVPLLAPPVDARDVPLAPVFERHLARASGYWAGPEHVDLSGTLDLQGEGYLAVTPQGQPPRFFRVQYGMSGRWSAGGRGYSVSLSVSIFRPRLNNVIVVKDDAGRTVWQMTIRELFRHTYAAGEPVTLAGRPYRLFYSREPDGSGRTGLCFIYEELDGVTREYHFYLIPMEQLLTDVPTSYRMFGGDQIRLRVTPDRSTLEIGR